MPPKKSTKRLKTTRTKKKTTNTAGRKNPFFPTTEGELEYSTEEIVDDFADFDDEGYGASSAGVASVDLTSLNLSAQLWAEKYEPLLTGELAVHAKKIEDVRHWIQGTLDGTLRKKFLILEGPAGVGKTTTIKAISRELGVSILEWESPMTNGIDSIFSQFDYFLTSADRYNALSFDTQVTSQSGGIILLEDLPNTFSSNQELVHRFRNLLIQHILSPFTRHPCILIISETETHGDDALRVSFSARRLLGREICEHPKVDTIKFNAVARTLMLKAMDRVLDKERFSKRPSYGALESLAHGGDIRSAINGLQFVCIRLQGLRGVQQKRKRGQAAPTMAEAERQIVNSITQRESSIGLFHAIGKVVHNKRYPDDPIQPKPFVLPDPPAMLSQYARRPSYVVPEVVLDESGMEYASFLLAIHENFLPSATEISQVDICMGYLSDADLIPNAGMKGLVGVSGMLFSLPQKVHRNVYKLYFPTSLRLKTHTDAIDAALSDYRGGNKATLLTETIPYKNRIQRKQALDNVVSFKGLERIEDIFAGQDIQPARPARPARVAEDDIEEITSPVGAHDEIIDEISEFED